MNPGTRSAVRAVLAVLMVSVAAEAQPVWDVAGVAGSFSGRVRDEGAERQYDDWFTTGVGSVVVGRYFSPHLKVELDAGITGTGTQFIQRYVNVPGYASRYPIGAEAKSSVRSFGAGLSWQFFENEWVHPFVTAGLSVESDRRSVHTWQQFYYPGDPRIPGNQIVLVPETREGPHTTTHARALLGGGAKVYVLERAFIRADGRVSFDAGQQNVAFRVGAGIDF